MKRAQRSKLNLQKLNQKTYQEAEETILNISRSLINLGPQFHNPFYPWLNAITSTNFQMPKKQLQPSQIFPQIQIALSKHIETLSYKEHVFIMSKAIQMVLPLHHSKKCSGCPCPLPRPALYSILPDPSLFKAIFRPRAFFAPPTQVLHLSSTALYVYSSLPISNTALF